MRKFRLICTLLAAMLMLGACGGPLPGTTPTPVLPKPGEPPLGMTETAPPDGIDANTPEPVVEEQTARPTPTPWFPITRYVAPSKLPYDAQETVWILPVYACPGQSCLWLGDLAAGLEMRVTALSDDMQDCFVSGKTVQGWEVEGWVSCSRLEAERSVTTP